MYSFITFIINILREKPFNPEIIKTTKNKNYIQ